MDERLDPIVVLTPAGRARMRARLEELAGVAAELERAVAEDERGDVRARYQLAIRESEEIEEAFRRAVQLEDLPDDPSIVEVGDEVALRFENGKIETYVIVHPVEAPLDPAWISCESPLSRAILGQRIGAEVVVSAPGGDYRARISSRRRTRSNLRESIRAAEPTT
ncbi:MAG: GreA/GreB family elongation factor [Actinomycetota bacterium]